MLVQLIHTVPALIAGATSSAKFTSSLHTLAARPYRVSLASATASAGVRKVKLTMTGPKISSVASALDGWMPVHRTGGKNRPSSGTGQEGRHTSAPSASPCSRYARMRSSWTRSTTAPMSMALSSG